MESTEFRERAAEIRGFLTIPRDKPVGALNLLVRSRRPAEELEVGRGWFSFASGNPLFFLGKTGLRFECIFVRERPRGCFAKDEDRQTPFKAEP